MTMVATSPNESSSDSEAETPEIGGTMPPPPPPLRSPQGIRTPGVQTAPIASVSTVRVHKPKKPKMGGLTEVATNTWVPWTGGKPKEDWSGLKDPSPAVEPNWYRPTSVSTATKNQQYRIAGIGELTKSGDLMTFQRMFQDKLEEYGMDGISYLPNPANPKQLIKVVSEHGWYNLKDGVKAANDVSKKYYDEYDKANQKDAIKLLLNSLDSELRKSMYENCEKDASFGAHWFHLINIMGATNASKFDKIKNCLKLRKIEDYSGEDIEALASDYNTDYEELHDAGMYDHNLTMVSK